MYRLRQMLLATPRPALALITFGGNVLYLITNRLLHGGVMPRLPIDDAIPLWPIWTIPYVLILPWWLGMLIWMMLRMNDVEFRRVSLAAILTLYISIAVFVIYPTYIERPSTEGVGLGLVRWLYSLDHVNNALPSVHMSLTTLIVVACWSWQPRLRMLWAAMIPLTVASTLFTRQHYVLDLVAGALLAIVCFVFASRVMRPTPLDA